VSGVADWRLSAAIPHELAAPTSLSPDAAMADFQKFQMSFASFGTAQPTNMFPVIPPPPSTNPTMEEADTD
jgi:hypothetical protein